MPQVPGRFSRFWNELKRRKVLRSLAIYAGTAFIILEAATIIFPRWNLPDWSIDLVLWLLILGAFVNVIIAWFYDITSDGIQRTKSFEESTRNDRIPDSRGWKAATYISLVVIVGLIVLHIAGGPKELKAGDIQSLVILPFENYTGDDQLENMVAGMHASLVNDMGQISGLRVISKTSAAAYRGADMTATEIARELKVDDVVEASVLCLGDSMCMQFRLIDATGEEKQLWNADYREKKSQVLNLFNQITRQIAQEVKIELLPGEQQRLFMDRKVNPDAYDTFLKAQYNWERLTPQGMDSAIHYYQLAIDLDPDWADPYAGMAMTLGVMGNFSKGLMESDRKGQKDYLDRALELDPLRPLVLGLYSVVMLHLDRPHEALIQSKKALDIDENNGFAVGTLADASLALGDTTEWYKLWRQGLWWTTPSYLDSLDRVFEEQGYMAVIRYRIRTNAEVLASGGFIPFSGQAYRYLVVGEYDRAMDCYRKGMEAGDGLISYIALDHLDFPELKTHPKYLALLQELNLPPPALLTGE